MSDQWVVRCVRVSTVHAADREAGAYLPVGWEPFAVEDGGFVWLRWKMPSGAPGSIATSEPVAAVSEAPTGSSVAEGSGQ